MLKSKMQEKEEQCELSLEHLEGVNILALAKWFGRGARSEDDRTEVLSDLTEENVSQEETSVNKIDAAAAAVVSEAQRHEMSQPERGTCTWREAPCTWQDPPPTKQDSARPLPTHEIALKLDELTHSQSGSGTVAFILQSVAKQKAEGKEHRLSHSAADPTNSASTAMEMLPSTSVAVVDDEKRTKSGLISSNYSPLPQRQQQTQSDIDADSEVERILRGKCDQQEILD